VKDAEAKVQKYTDAHIADVDKLFVKKEAEIMNI
jgi:ribosome recycling factor